MLYICILEASRYGTVYPKIQVAYAGSRVMMICYSFTPPLWTRKGKSLQSQKNDILVLERVSELYNGYYDCEGTLNINGTRFKAKTDLLVGGKILEILLRCFKRRGLVCVCVCGFFFNILDFICN